MVLSDLVASGSLDYMLISKIIQQNYPALFGQKDSAATKKNNSIFVKALVVFLGSSRHQLEDLELEKGRRYRFGEILSEDDQANL